MRRNILLLSVMVTAIFTVARTEARPANPRHIEPTYPDSDTPDVRRVVLSETETYVDLRTGTIFRLHWDAPTNTYVRDDSLPLDIYAGTIGLDTFWGAQAIPVNNSLIRDGAGYYTVDQALMERKVKENENELKVKGDGYKIKENENGLQVKDEDSKLKTNENEFKLKNEDAKIKSNENGIQIKDGEDKIKANENELKMKDGDSKVKANENEYKEKDGDAKLKENENERKYKDDGVKVKRNDKETKIKTDDSKTKINNRTGEVKTKPR